MAAYAVVYEHLVIAPAFAYSAGASRLWGGPQAPVPLLDPASYDGWRLSSWVHRLGDASLAAWGVALFFLISGWLIVPMSARYPGWQLLRNRAWRIYPMLVVAVLLAACLQGLSGSGASLTPTALLCTATLASPWTDTPSTLPVTWTLAIEMQFYVITACIGIWSPKRIAGFFALVGGLSALLAAAQHYNFPVSMAFIEGLGHLAHDGLFLCFMLLGTTLHWIWRKQTGWRVFVALWAGFALLLWGAQSAGVKPYQSLGWGVQALALGTFAACLLWQSRARAEGLVAWCISRAAELTYSIYLLHLSVGVFALSAWRPALPTAWRLALIVAALTVLSWVTYRGIEMPCRVQGKAAPRKGRSAKRENLRGSAQAAPR